MSSVFLPLHPRLQVKKNRAGAGGFVFSGQIYGNKPF
jgi:hypothetical protein